MMTDRPPGDDSPHDVDSASAQPPPPASRASWSSDELLGDHQEVLIVHGSQTYRLRRTRQDKLILYK